MNRVEELIQQLCPNGVEWKKLGEVCDLIRGKVYSKDYLKNNPGDYPVYSSQTANNGELGRISTYDYDGEFLTWTTDGAYAGTIFHRKGRFSITNVCGLIKIQSGLLIIRFLYYWLSLKAKDYVYQGMGNPKLMSNQMETIPIPIPPLPIQQEIVRILDTFTELQKELTANLQTELDVRKKQYAYYRDCLLNFEGVDGVEWKKLGEIANFRRGSFPQPYGKKEWYDGIGAMPFVQVADISDNKQLVKETSRKISIVAQPKSVFAPKGSIIISLQGSIGRIAVTQYDAYIDRTIAIFQDISKNIIPTYFVYQLERIFEEKEKKARGGIIKTITKEEFTEFPIPIPPLPEQRRIVAILDHFETLVNDLSVGLPAELEARRKQYEYYRDKLLTFDRV